MPGLQIVEDVLQRGKVPIVVGGSNYYIQVSDPYYMSECVSAIYPTHATSSVTVRILAVTKFRRKLNAAVPACSLLDTGIGRHAYMCSPCFPFAPLCMAVGLIQA